MSDFFMSSPNYDKHYEENCFVRMSTHTDDSDRTGYEPVWFKVECRNVDGDWVVPVGWASKVLSKISSNFAWRECPIGAFVQITRWLEMQLYIHGRLDPSLQVMLYNMTKQDFLDTFNNNLSRGPLTRHPRPYEIEDLKARIWRES